MKRFAITACFLALAFGTLSAQNVKFAWSTDPIDGHRTGVVASSASDVPEAMGIVKGKKYRSPSGRVFRRGSTPKVAKIMIDAQPAMAVNKQVIGSSPRVMSSGYPECALYDWFIDELMRAVQDSTGKKVDIGFANRGGVRTDMPEGDVFYDDIMSMFPFKNRICRVALRGSAVRELIERMNSRSFQIIGGAKIIVKDGKVISIKVNGEPLDDGKLYGLATIDFLLDGGDGYRIAANSEETTICDNYLYETMLAYVKSLTAAGKQIEFENQGWITIIGEGDDE